MTFSEIMKHIRKQQNCAQKQFTRELNVSFSTISSRENDHTAPNVLAKMRLLECCKMNCVDNAIMTELANY